MKGQALRVLLIEDNEQHTSLMHAWLTRFERPVELSHADNYEDGLESLLRREHDVCLLDYRLGPQDGLSLLESAVAAGCSVPVIMLTSHGNRNIDLRAAEVGAADFLDKSSLNSELLERSIRYAIATRKLEGERSRLVSVLEATTDFVGAVDAAEGRMTYLNRGGRAMVGLGSSEDASAMRLTDFHSPEALELLENEAFPYAAAHGVWTGEVSYLHRDGREVPASMVLVAHRNADGQLEYYSCVSRDLTLRKQAQAEIAALASFPNDHIGPVLRVDDGGAVLYANDAAASLLRPWDLHVDGVVPPAIFRLIEQASASGAAAQSEVECDSRTYLMTASRVAPAGYFNVYGVDVTDRKRTEDLLRRTEEKFRQSQKLEAIGRLAGGIAHDFNNLLTIINGYCDLLLEEDGLGEATGEGLQVIKDAGRRAASLTSQLLAFSRKQMLAPEIVNLNSVVLEVEGMLRRLIGEDIELKTRLNPNLGQSKVDPSQMQQVLLNLALNARDAMPFGGELVLRTRNIRIDDNDAEEHDMAPGPYVALSVSDNGCGMDEDTQSRIFEPFFSTKEEGKGTGLGLSTAFGIIKQSGGHVSVESELGKGATFHVFLPATPVDDPSSANAGEGAEPPLPAGRETVLVVEDEALVRNVARRILEKRGYEVLEASDGQEALKRVDEHAGKIDLLLTDVVMPQMSGRELADRLCLSQPRMKVLFMSGYTDDSMVRHGVSQSSVEFIHKPFSSSHLAQKVREVIDEPQPFGATDLAIAAAALEEAHCG